MQISRASSEIERKLSPFIYLAANGRGKSRSKGANFPNLRWRTTTVVNGEIDIRAFRAKHRGGGQDARLLVLPVPTKSSGGIWTTPMLLKKREKNILKLDRLCGTYTGHSYRNWLKYLAVRYDKVKASFEANVEKHTLALAGGDADGVARARARKYAQIIATGDELIKYGTLEWDASLPFGAIQRLYNADALPVAPIVGAVEDLRAPSTEILAQIACGAIPFSENGRESEHKACRVKWNGEEFVMIKRDLLPEFVSGPPMKVANAFKAAGASRCSGTTPFFQYKKTGERYLRVSLAQIKRLAGRT